MNYALVTGGSRGIGRAVCVKLASAGCKIIINYVSNEASALETADLVRRSGGTAELLRFNVGDAQQTSEAVKGWQEAHPEDYIEILVNNAGIRHDNLLIWMKQEEWATVLDTTLNGFFNVTRSVLTPMLLHKYGRIINIASLSGLKGLPGQANYSAAKGGLIAATKALAQEVARKNITVNAVAPGFINTSMVDGLDENELKKTVPMRRFGEPEEVASLVAFLASKEAGYITGDCISINGGLY